MREFFTLPAGAVAPSLEEVFSLLGMRGAGRHEAVAAAALENLVRLARPSGVVQDIGRDDFEALLTGGGCPAATPIGRVLPEAARHAVYAVTLGPAAEERIAALFAAGDELAGLLLDASASCAAERASRMVVQRTLERWGRDGAVGAGTAALGYSPGYCGWPVAGQRTLFGALRPEEAGIVLGDSCLMAPLKSVSGVVLAGPPNAFEDPRDYPFCEGCKHPDCIERTRSMPVWNE